jgi:hypothetical protein
VSKDQKPNVELKEVGPDVSWRDGAITNVAVAGELEQKRKVGAKSAAEKL